MSDKHLLERRGASLLTGGAHLALATLVQRGFGFIANVGAARIGGAAAFGEYQICLVTVTTIASYIGLGIGNTTLRYGAAHPPGGREYRQIWKILWRWALISAVVSALVVTLTAMLGASAGIASGLPEGTLSFAIPSAFAVVIYEFIWTVLLVRTEYRRMIGLALATGIAMIGVLAASAYFGAKAMLIGHGAILLLAVVGVLAIRATVRSPLAVCAEPGHSSSVLREMLRFGFAQVLGTAGLALASWWVLIQVSWHDPSQAAVGHFAVALQIRVLSTLLPALVSQQVLPSLARENDDLKRGIISWQYAFLVGSLAACGGGVLLAALPFIIQVYGSGYQSASMAAILLISCAVIQMGNVGPFMYLMYSATRTAALISFAASTILAVAATMLVPSYGATGGAAAWLIAEGFSSMACLFAISLRGRAKPSAFGWTLLLYAAVGLLAISSAARSTISTPTVEVASLMTIVAVTTGFGWTLAKSGANWLRRSVDN